MFPVWHIGSNFLHEIAKAWYSFLVNKGVKFKWNVEVNAIDFENDRVLSKSTNSELSHEDRYDKLIFAVGKSGIDFAQQLADDYQLPNEPKSVQIGVRFEAPQKYFQKLIDVSYDFKLYKKFDNVSLRTFCTNNNAAYVAVEETYGDITYNGHAKKGKKFENKMTNFGILMEIKGIDNPFEWSRDVVKKLQINGTGTYYSPNKTRKPSLTSENNTVSAVQVDTIDPLFEALGEEYAQYIEDFITEMQIIFPEMKNDWGIYMPEVKYLSPEPLVRYHDLSLTEYSNVHFVGDALSARGITVSGAQGIYVAEKLIRKEALIELTK
jgi:uncharacterized FAD-dependent dehydrogenase